MERYLVLSLLRANLKLPCLVSVRCIDQSLGDLLILCAVQSLSDALISLQMVYPRRNLSADQWRNAQLLSLISAPSTMLNPAQSDTVSAWGHASVSAYIMCAVCSMPVLLYISVCHFAYLMP